MAGEEQEAVGHVLRLLRQKGAAWIRRGDFRETAATRAVAAKFDPMREADIQNRMLAEENKGQFEEKEIIFIPPPAKESGAAAGLWCRWDYDRAIPRCGFYLGIWSMQSPFPRPNAAAGRVPRSVAFVGYRYETPELGDNHNYYHAQPTRSLGERGAQDVEEALPISHRAPTWPIAADDALELLLCLVTSMYGMRGLEELRADVRNDIAARRNRELDRALKTIAGLCVPRVIPAAGSGA